MPALIFVTGVYGGYFGAAQGVILLALLGLGIDDTLQRLNGLKNAITVLVNGVAAILFAFASTPAWGVSALDRDQFDRRSPARRHVARRIPDAVLRAVVVVGGLTVGIVLAVR